MERMIRVTHLSQGNLAEEYAKHFHLPGKGSDEAAWQFRERIARNLEKMEMQLLAHEVLYNQHITSDIFAYGEISSGYGDEFITRRAKQTELAWQYAKRQKERRERWKELLAIFCFWQKPAVEQ